MKLLVMEDEIRLADILSDWFQKKGFEVTVCHDGLSGYEKAQNENFDVILPGPGRFPAGEKAAGEKDRDAGPFSDGAGGASEGNMSLFASMNLQIA